MSYDKFGLEYKKAKAKELANLKASQRNSIAMAKATKEYYINDITPTDLTPQQTTAERLADINKLRHIAREDLFVLLQDGEQVNNFLADEWLNNDIEALSTFIQLFPQIQDDLLNRKKMKFITGSFLNDYLRKYISNYNETLGLETGLKASEVQDIVEAGVQDIAYSGNTGIYNPVYAGKENTEMITEMIKRVNKIPDKKTLAQLVDEFDPASTSKVLRGKTLSLRTETNMKNLIKAALKAGIEDGTYQLPIDGFENALETSSSMPMSSLLSVSVSAPESSVVASGHRSSNTSTIPELKSTHNIAGANHPAYLAKTAEELFSGPPPTQKLATPKKETTKKPPSTPIKKADHGVTSSVASPQSNKKNREDKTEVEMLSFLRLAPLSANVKRLADIINALAGKTVYDIFSSPSPRWNDMLKHFEPIFMDYVMSGHLKWSDKKGFTCIGPNGEKKQGLGLSRVNIIKNKVFKYGRGISYEEKPKWVEFGKFVIHIPFLEENMLAIRYKSLGQIPSFNKKQKVSSQFSDFLRNVLETEKVNQHEFKNLDVNEKILFEKICKLACLSQKLGISTNTKTDDEKKMLSRFELLRGELLAGNDSPIIKKECIQFLKLFMKNGMITKESACDLILELQ